MRPDTVTRYGATIKGRFVTRDNLLRHYVCRKCGGAILHTFRWSTERQDTEDVLRCGNCGGDDIIRESEYNQQRADGLAVLYDLPEEIARTLK